MERLLTDYQLQLLLEAKGQRLKDEAKRQREAIKNRPEPESAAKRVRDRINAE